MRAIALHVGGQTQASHPLLKRPVLSPHLHLVRLRRPHRSPRFHLGLPVMRLLRPVRTPPHGKHQVGSVEGLRARRRDARHIQCRGLRSGETKPKDKRDVHKLRHPVLRQPDRRRTGRTPAPSTGMCSNSPRARAENDRRVWGSRWASNSLNALLRRGTSPLRLPLGRTHDRGKAIKMGKLVDGSPDRGIPSWP